MKFDIKNLSDNKAQLFMYGNIVSDELEAWSIDDQFPSSIRDFLAEYKGKEIEVHLNSGGGSCFAGICIAEMLKKHEGKTVAIIDGLCASISTVIACACDEIHITPNSYFMIHNAWVGACGNKEDLQETINLLEKMDKTIADAYEKHLKEGVTRNQIVDMMKAETWLCGNEILDYFNFILEDEKQVAYAKVDLNNYKNIPQSLLNELEEEKEEDDVCKECQKNPCECEQEEQVEVEEVQDEVCEECGKEICECEKVKDEEKEEEQVEQEDEEVQEEPCEECHENPCRCEEIKRQQEEEKQQEIAHAKKELDFINARAFLDNLLK